MSNEKLLKALDKLILWFEERNKNQIVITLTNIRNEFVFRIPEKATAKESMCKDTYRCPNCNRILVHLGKTEYDAEGYGFVDYCPHCGKAINWDGIK